jgi:hypothetical protein
MRVFRIVKTPAPTFVRWPRCTFGKVMLATLPD